jgi:hypothetical protein
MTTAQQNEKDLAKAIAREAVFSGRDIERVVAESCSLLTAETQKRIARLAAASNL